MPTTWKAFGVAIRKNAVVSRQDFGATAGSLAIFDECMKLDGGKLVR